MGMINDIIDKIDIVSEFVPVDMHAANNNGTWVDLSKFEGCIFILHKGIGTTGQDPIFLVQQAQDNQGTGAKNLDYLRVRQKIGATSVEAVPQATEYLYAGAGAYVARTDGASPVDDDGQANSYKPVSAAEEALMWVIVNASDLDVKGGFTHARLEIAAVGANAQLGSAIALMVGPRYAEYPNQSAIG